MSLTYCDCDYYYDKFIAKCPTSTGLLSSNATFFSSGLSLADPPPLGSMLVVISSIVVVSISVITYLCREK